MTIMDDELDSFGNQNIAITTTNEVTNLLTFGGFSLATFISKTLSRENLSSEVVISDFEKLPTMRALNII